MSVYLTSGAPGSEHDPEPWAYSRTSKSGEGLFGTPDRSAERYDRAMHWFPRPEFDHHNSLLVEFRKDYDEWVLESHGECTLDGAAREVLGWRDNPEAHFPLTAEEQHLRRVLTRIINLTNEPLEG